jgi:hypothetical protein
MVAFSGPFPLSVVSDEPSALSGQRSAIGLLFLSSGIPGIHAGTAQSGHLVIGLIAQAGPSDD